MRKKVLIEVLTICTVRITDWLDVIIGRGTDPKPSPVPSPSPSKKSVDNADRGIDSKPDPDPVPPPSVITIKDLIKLQEIMADLKIELDKLR